MSEKYKFSDSSRLYFITYTVINWMDVFIRPQYNHILLSSWAHCQKEKGLEIYAWCIMSSHVHMIVSSNKNPLADIVRDRKAYTSKKIREAINDNPEESRKEWMLWMMERAAKRYARESTFQFWQPGNHAVELNTNEMIDQRLNYIHDNPVKAGMVDKPQDYVYSSARDYCGEKGLVDVILIWIKKWCSGRCQVCRTDGRPREYGPPSQLAICINK